MEEVNIYIDNLDEIFNTFDNNDISDELALYIENRCTRLKNNKMVIKFISEYEVSKENQSKIINALRSHFGLEIKYNTLENKKRNIINLIIMLVGLLILLFKNILPLTTTIFDIFDIFACFMIWESTYNLLFTDNESDIKIARAKKIISAKITFIKD